jgi:Ser/Thr protein kinase RdoA (MazF antagonist)
VAGEAAAAGRGVDRIGRALEAQAAAALPRRSVHNDCKINNVMLDAATGEAVCVIDLDTVMEGTVLFDFGDLVRTAACPSPEDAVDLAAMRFDLGLFEALARGYLAGGADFLGEAEIAALPLAGSVLALENAIRFLGDFVSGDVYFRIHREGHNLDRARAQLRLVELMEEAGDATRRIVERARRGRR